MGAKGTYCMFMSIAGCLYFLFITFSCFFGMEVLKLKEGTRLSRGFAAFVVAIVINNHIINIFIQIYGGIAAFIYYSKKKEEEGLRIFYNIEHEDQNLKNRISVDY